MAVDPAALAAQQALEAAKTAPPPVTAPETKPQLLQELEPLLKEKAPEAYQHIAELRTESKNHRLEKQELSRQLAEAQNKLTEIQAEAAERERKELEAKGEYQKLYEQEKQERQTELKAARIALIETTIEKAAIEQGIHPKLIKLITKHGTHVTEAGEVQGVDRAIERFREEHADLIEMTAPAKATNNGGASGAATTPPPVVGEQAPGTIDMKIPGTNMTYKEYQKVNAANAGAAPPPTTAAPPAKDVRNMTKAQADEWYKGFKQGLGKK
jgi:Skp family chaperone for outer membrane proteins